MPAKQEKQKPDLRLSTKDGKFFDFYRDKNGTVRVCRDEEQCVILPHGTGKMTIQLFSILESLGEIVEEDDDE